MRRAWTGGAAVFLAVFTLVGAPVWAQAAGQAAPGGGPPGAAPKGAAPTGPSVSASEAASAKAEALFKEGREAIAKQSWAVAEAKFEGAFALNPSYDVATNLGNTQFRLGKLRAAADHLAFALRVWPLSAKLDQRELVTKRVAELRKTLATLTIRVNVEGAAVFVDGTSVGRSPLTAELFVEPGARVIEAKLGGYEDAKRSMDVAKGGAEEVVLTLAALPGAAGPKASGPVAPDVKPPGEIKEEGKTVGGASKPLIIAGAATSGALIGAGVVFAIVWNIKGTQEAQFREALDEKRNPKACSMSLPDPMCRDIASSLASQETFAALTLWSFVAGGLLGAGTAVYALATPRPKKSTSTVRAVPMLGPHGSGFALVGTW